MKYIPIARPELPTRGAFSKSVRAIWDSHILSNFGPFAQQLEGLALEYTGAEHLAAVSSCDLGLIITLKALDLRRESEAIVPSFTFASTVNAVSWNALRPSFADISPNSFCLDPNDVNERVTRSTSVIVATHIFGRPAETRALEQIAADANIPLVFDAAHAFGSAVGSRRVGTFGTAEVFSLSGTKVVTSGEGGLIATNSRELDRRVRYIRGYGFVGDYNPRFLGINGKISELNAALGCLTLPHVDEAVSKRERLASRYRETLSRVRAIQFQSIPADLKSTHKDFALLVPQRRNQLQRSMQRNGIQTKVYFRPLHTSSYFRPFSKRRLPVTERIARSILCIPILTNLSKPDQDRIVHAIINYFTG